MIQQSPLSVVIKFEKLLLRRFCAHDAAKMYKLIDEDGVDLIRRLYNALLHYISFHGYLCLRGYITAWNDLKLEATVCLGRGLMGVQGSGRVMLS